MRKYGLKRMRNRDLERMSGRDLEHMRNRDLKRKHDNGSADDELSALRSVLGILAKNYFDGANSNNTSRASLHISDICAGGNSRIVNVFSGSADVTMADVAIGGDAQIFNIFLDDETIARLQQIQQANHSRSTEIDLRKY